MSTLLRLRMFETLTSSCFVSHLLCLALCPCRGRKLIHISCGLPHQPLILTCSAPMRFPYIGTSAKLIQNERGLEIHVCSWETICNPGGSTPDHFSHAWFLSLSRVGRASGVLARQRCRKSWQSGQTNRNHVFKHFGNMDLFFP